MIFDVLLWAPITVARHFLKPVTTTFESFSVMTNQAIDDYIKENPL